MPVPYLESVFNSGGLACMDGIAIHPYIPLPENLWRDVGETRELIKKYNNGREKPIYATEYGWASWNTDNPQQIGKFLVRGSVIMNAQNVRSMHWFQFLDEPGFMSMGLVHAPNDARGKYSPSPALVAYATLVRAFSRRQVRGPRGRRAPYQRLGIPFQGWHRRGSRLLEQPRRQAPNRHGNRLAPHQDRPDGQ